jgi:hypothetical protein
MYRSLVFLEATEMGRSKSLALWTTWRERVERHASSGLTIADFCGRKECSVNNFYVWKRRLKREMHGSVRTDGRLADARPRQREERATQPAPVSKFVKVPIVASPLDSLVEFVLVDGTIVRVPPSHGMAMKRVLDTVLHGHATRVPGGRHNA